MARLIRRKEVKEKVGLSDSTIWRKEREGTFPKRRKIGYSVAWLETEIDQWIRSLGEKQ